MRLASDRSHGFDVAVNTLNVTGSRLTLSNNATVTLAGGGLILDGGATDSASIRGNGTLALPATEGIVHVFPRTPEFRRPGVYSIDVPITGGKLVMAGGGS